MPTHDNATLARGRRLMRSLLPALRAEAARTPDGPGLEEGNPLVGTLLQFMDHAELESLLVYQGARGGWIADVVLSGIPRGYGDTVGTPASRPRSTRAEAEADGRDTALRVLRTIARLRTAPASPADPVFVLHGVAITLHRDTLDRLREAVASGMVGTYGSEAAARARIDEVTGETVQGAVTKERLDALPREDQLRLVSVLTMASMDGVHRHPATAMPPEDTGVRH